ncbi:hypothetical protein GPALN_004530 [Globodera pallida]|nr:hypothetical protein GPALN_004530 [Globodera pallida]
MARPLHRHAFDARKVGLGHPVNWDRLARLEPRGLPDAQAQKARLVSKGRKDRPDPLAKKAQLVSQESDVEEWLDKDEAEDLKKPAPTNFGQNVHHQIDRQNTQIGQIEPNSTDQNPSLTESDHSDNAKNCEEQNEVSSNKNIAEDERKQKFDRKKAELTRDGFKNSYKEEIDKFVAKELGLSVATIYRWKKQQLHQNSVDGHSVEENAGSNVQELGTRTREVFE